jgi:hypothetical protein
MDESRCEGAGFPRGIGSQTALGGRHEGDDRRRRLVADARGEMVPASVHAPGTPPRPAGRPFIALGSRENTCPVRDWLGGGADGLGPIGEAADRGWFGSGRVDSIRFGGPAGAGASRPDSSRRGRGALARREAVARCVARARCPQGSAARRGTLGPLVPASVGRSARHAPAPVGPPRVLCYDFMNVSGSNGIPLGGPGCSPTGAAQP